MIVSRGGLLNQKGNIRKRMLVVGITGLLAIAFTALLLPTMAGAAVKGPYINILAPGAGSIWRGTKEITWEQVDVSGEMTIEWATGDTAAPTDPAAWTLIATRSTATAGTYSCSWDTTSVSDGTNYFVRVRPTGEYTPIGTSGQFTIDNTPPQPTSAEFMNDTQVNITFNENLNTSYIDSTRFALSSSSVSHVSSSSAAVSTSNMQVVTVTFDKGTIPASVQANGDNC